jgi:predicted kinase
LNYETIKAVFETSALAWTMRGEVEGSPYHREANVFEHTTMVCDEAKSFAMPGSDLYNVIMTAALFHDCGKPMSRIEKYREDRGHYRAYHGHDRAGSRLVEDFFSTHFKIIDPYFVLAVMFLVEQHQAYDIKDTKKLANLKSTLQFLSMKTGVNMTIALRCLMVADGNGRIVDDQNAYGRMHNEAEEFIQTVLDSVEYRVVNQDKVMTILVGASGSGKSTWVRRYGIPTFSLDNVRHEVAKTDNYRIAFTYCNENSQEFSKAVDKAFREKVTSGESFVVDNTNTSRKSRQRWIDEARRHGYNVEVVMFPTSLSTIIGRQEVRGDKYVPEDAVRRQYFGIDIPKIGEVDWIHICSG